MATYYVHKGVGSDSNNGTSWATAFASLGKAYTVSGNNDTVYVRAGATPYYERLSLQRSGQTWRADSGHTPIIDGKYHPGLSDFLLWNKPAGTYVVQADGSGGAGVEPPIVTVGGSYNELDGFVVRNVAGNGILCGGQFNQVRNCKVDFTYGANIYINGDTDTCRGHLVEDCESSRGGIKRFCQADWDHWGGNANSAGVTVINLMKNCSESTFRRLKCHHNHGENLVVGKGSRDCIIEYCEVWTSHHMNIYVNNSRNPIIRYNLSWSVPNPEFTRNGTHPEPIVIGDELHGSKQLGGNWSQNQRIYGNVFVGGTRLLQMRDGNSYDTKTKNCYIGYNTFVALAGVTNTAMDVTAIDGESHQNFLMENNVIYVPQGVTRFASNNGTVSGIKCRNNVIYAPAGMQLPAWIDGPGNIIADPKLVNPTFALQDYAGHLDRPIDAGNNMDVTRYKLTSTSPAINAAVTSYPYNGNSGVLEARQKDYFGAAKGTSPDEGAHEFGGTVADSVTAAFTRTPAATSLVVGAAVAFTNTSFTTGAATITGQTWTVRKSGTVVATATTANYNYTFASTGSYTVELAVTASGGLSDSETLAYTITEGGGGVVVTAAFSAAPAQTTIPQGYTIAFTDQTTVQNGTQAGRTWQVLTVPALTVVHTATTATLFYQFNAAGTFRVKLTATATTGESDTETLDYTVTSVTTPTVSASFTMSDGDGVVPVGTAVTFTDTSTASNTTITGRAWSVQRVGSGQGAHTYATQNITHTFTQAGTYTVTLVTTTAAGISDTETATVTVQVGATTGMDFMVVPVSFAVNTSTGTQTVTAAALGSKIPKGVHIRLVGATAVGTAAAGAIYSDGAGSDTAQWVHTRVSADSAGTTAARRRWSSGAIIMTLDSAGAVTGQASLIRFVAGGMELNVSDGFPSGYRAEALFFAGDVCDFWAGSVGVGAVNANTAVVTGIDQDAVYLMTTWSASENTTDTDAEMSRGWAIAPDPESEDAGAQFHFRNEDQHGKDTSAVFGRWQPRIASANEQPDGYSTIEIADFHVGGFNLRPASAGMGGRVASMYAFAAGGYRVSLHAVQMDTGATWTHGLDFEAQTVTGLVGSFTGDANTQLGGTQPETSGWLTVSTHGPATISGNIAAANGAATSSTRSYLATAARAVGPSSADLWNGAAALDAAGLTVTWTAAPAAAYRAVLLGIEVGQIQGATDDPVADFSADVDANERTGRASVWFSSAQSSGNGQTITAWLWDFGDGTTSTEANPMHIYEQPGAYTVSLTVTTSAGSDTKTVESLVLVQMVEGTADIVGPSNPKTIGGQTGNEIDENGDHTHAARFDWAHFRALDASAVATFVEMQPDAEYALGGYDVGNHRFVVKEPDGSLRYIVTTT